MTLPHAPRFSFIFYTCLVFFYGNRGDCCWKKAPKEPTTAAVTAVKSSQVPVVGLRDRVAIIRTTVKSSQVVGLRDRVAISVVIIQN